MILITFLSIIAFLLVSATGYSAPVVLTNALSFEERDFKLVDFNSPNMNTESRINSYLSAYNANVSKFSGVIATSENYYTNITGNCFYHSFGNFGVNFNTPVNAAGIFYIGMNYSGDTNVMTVTYADASVETFSYKDYLGNASHAYVVNGFIGIYAPDKKISKIEYKWTNDIASVDNFYFGDNVNSDYYTELGQTNIHFNNKDTILLPAYSDPPFPQKPQPQPVPEPMTALLLGLGTVSLIRKQFFKK